MTLNIFSGTTLTHGDTIQDKLFYQYLKSNINFAFSQKIYYEKDQQVIDFIISQGFDIIAIIDSAAGTYYSEDSNFYYAFFNKRKKIIITFGVVFLKHYASIGFFIPNLKLENLIKSLKNDFQKKFPIPNKEVIPVFRMIVQESYGYQYMTVETPKLNLDLYLNYNQDFLRFNNKLIDFLYLKKPGLVLFSGKYGTGKSHYIRHLICNNPTIEFVFVPPTVISNMGEPAFLQFFLSNATNKVFIVEDAELALSTILNWTDGLIGSSLNTKFICTINTALENVDSALRRKGRLMAEYVFDQLTVEKSNNLLNNLKINHRTDEPMTLAEIYNFTDTNSFGERKEEKSIGFANLINKN